MLDQAGEAVLTCTFVPGGKFGGVGIRSYLYCANCSQGHLWHLIAQGLQLIETAEEIVRAAGELEAIGDRVGPVLRDIQAAARIAAECSDTLSRSGHGRGGSSV